MAYKWTKQGATVDCTIANSRVRACVPILNLNFVILMKIENVSVLLVRGRVISKRVELRATSSVVYRTVVFKMSFDR